MRMVRESGESGQNFQGGGDKPTRSTKAGEHRQVQGIPAGRQGPGSVSK